MLLAGTPRAGPNRADRRRLLAFAGPSGSEGLDYELMGMGRRDGAAHRARSARFDRDRTLARTRPL